MDGETWEEYTESINLNLSNTEKFLAKIEYIDGTESNIKNKRKTINELIYYLKPPSIGSETHIAKQIQYTWEELSELSKTISDNYGTIEEGKINNDTAEIAVCINGKSDTLGIGDWTTVNGYQVRILGFNHDTLATEKENDDGTTTTIVSQYGAGTTNIYAGISFEFAECIGPAKMNNTNTNEGGWKACQLRETLNSTTYNNLENKEYIKEVNKQYIEINNDANSVKETSDKLWLLSCSEIWYDGYSNRGMYGMAVTSEGNRYKYYKIINASANTGTNKIQQSLLRSPVSGYKQYFCGMGYLSGHYGFWMAGSAQAGYPYLYRPCFSI